MIVLDGAYGEGGGQILRTALVLSLLTGQAFRIENVRLGRPQPGLKPQHLHIVRALEQMSDCRVEGAAPGALALTFAPGRIAGGSYHLDVGTAGAVPLVLQTLLPVCLFAGAPLSWRLQGGTEVRGAMTMDFWQRVLLPYYLPYAQRLALKVERMGFYPAGGGSVILEVEPRFDQSHWPEQMIRSPRLEATSRGELVKVEVVSRAAQALASRQVAERQVAAFAESLAPIRATPVVAYGDTRSPGSSMTAVAHYTHTRLGVDGLGERGKPAEAVGHEVAQRLGQEIAGRGTVDSNTADNLVFLVALFGGQYHFDHRTGHIETNVWTVEQFMPGRLKLAENQIANV
jgi:RNA 3'-phosphate cyclase